MNQFLRDALLDLLFQHMTAHIERGLSYDEALILGAAEIRRQIRGSRLDLVTTLINNTICDARYAREHGSKLH
jgi:hypothetical protein